MILFLINLIMGILNIVCFVVSSNWIGNLIIGCICLFASGCKFGEISSK